MSRRRRRSAIGCLICAVGVLLVCLRASLVSQPATQTEQTGSDPAVEDAASAPESASDATPDPTSALSDLVVTFVDVGQGDCTLVQLPDDKVMLVDAGEASAAGAVLDALEAAQVDKIDYLVASHPHADHIGGMEAVLGAYDVGEVWAPDAPATTLTYEGFLDAIDEKGLAINVAVAGAEIVSDDAGYTVDVLAPAEGTESEDMNDYSAIVRVTYGETSLLLTGDATAQEIVDASPGHVDVLKAAHHGSETGTDAAVMAETTPAYVVMSYAENNSYGHPDQSTLDAVAAAGSVACSTAANGNVTVTLDGEQVSVETERDGRIAAGASAEERARQEAEIENQTETEPHVDAEAQTQQQAEEMVVVTPTGEKYHLSGCRALSRSKSTSTVTKSEAEAMGLGPCAICNP